MATSKAMRRTPSATPQTRVIYAALAGNVAIAITKFIAAVLSGSSAMFSEGVHSLVDSGNELLLLYGLRRSKTPPDTSHPLGYGRELYFWNFVVALLVFAVGAGVSVYLGVARLRDPQPMGSLTVAYAVLGLSFVFEAASWRVALREFRKAKGGLGYLEAVRISKDPTTFTVLFEDSAALIGIVIALAGLIASHAFHAPQFDGAASIGIGLVLAATAMLLVRETKALLIGEQAYPHVQESVLRIAAEDEGVEHANGVITAQLGPQRVFAALSAEFRDDLTTPQIEACVNRIEARVKQAHPEIGTLFIKPQTAGTWKRRRAKLEAASEPEPDQPPS